MSCPWAHPSEGADGNSAERCNNGVNNTAWTGAASNSPAVAAPVGARGLETQSRN